MKTIQETLGLTPVQPYKSSKATPVHAADPALLYGLELEIEGIATEPTELYVGGMYGDADNSLRVTEHGRGWEFITKPATFSVVNAILTNFFNKSKLTQEKNYSERCSVHVHANVQDLTQDQLKSVCLLYQVFERILYSFAGNDRDKNIFCVPWSETNLTYNLIDEVDKYGIGKLRAWQKYTGLNLLPVLSQGTIEFRHLPGTCELPRILDWMQLIGCLFAYARRVPFEVVQKNIIEINTTSEYKGITQAVFMEWERVLDMPFLEQQIEEGVLNVKYMVLSQKENKTIKYPRLEEDVWLDEILRGGQDEQPQEVPIPRNDVREAINQIRAQQYRQAAFIRADGYAGQVHINPIPRPIRRR